MYTCPPNLRASNLHVLQHGSERHDELGEARVRLPHAIRRRALRVRLARAHLVRVGLGSGLGIGFGSGFGFGSGSGFGSGLGLGAHQRERRHVERALGLTDA